MRKARPYLAPALAALLATLALATQHAQAGMQWKWRDASGAIQYSDRPPPPGTPESAILTRPAGSARAASPRPVEAASEASSAASAKPADAELEAKRKKVDEERKKAEDEKAAKLKAEQEKQAKQQAENCQRARNYQRTLQDGIRIVRTNNKGEREVLDDAGRAAEMQRTQEAIQASCK
jgi:Domain of unknown function (DUF4124)